MHVIQKAKRFNKTSGILNQFIEIWMSNYYDRHDKLQNLIKQKLANLFKN